MGKPDFKAFKQIFDTIDADRSGKIDRNELQKALALMQLDMDKETIDQMLHLVDQDNDGQMDFEEFCIFVNVCENADPETPASVLFYAADLDYSGSIDRQELIKIFQKIDVNINKQQSEQIMADAADNADGSISYPMFLKLMDAMSQ
ncbi:EF_hand domain-containing protein [Hexamita inflata]|uniref:EF hand domain-containing protein n=1 Tax=Hexamita inflata TaxID=28002 RepID=A0AA86RD60_9EUKA|nr:EF hand domain-containing protein [Hexamita inflata]